MAEAFTTTGFNDGSCCSGPCGCLPPQPCPHCGHCPTCGRPRQSYPAWPQYPPYYVGDPPWWYYQTWCSSDTVT